MDDSLAQSNKSFISQEWVREYFATVDKLNVDNIIANFVEDGQFRFGNAEPAVGKEAIRDALVEFFSAINALAPRERWAMARGELSGFRGRSYLHSPRRDNCDVALR